MKGIQMMSILIVITIIVTCVTRIGMMIIGKRRKFLTKDGALISHPPSEHGVSHGLVFPIRNVGVSVLLFVRDEFLEAFVPFSIALLFVVVVVTASTMVCFG